MSEYGFSVTVPEGYDEAVVRARLALRSEGFSILTEAHVGGMLGADGASDDRQYLIMGAYASDKGHSVGDPNIQVGFHLPCNVVVHEGVGGAIVAALDPADAVEDGDEVTRRVVSDARDALERALRKVESPG
jgi:uncharacterized protein (DUF302 family)